MKVLSLTPARRQSSLILAPASCSFNNLTICSVVNLDFRIGPTQARTEIITESVFGFQVRAAAEANIQCPSLLPLVVDKR